MVVHSMLTKRRIERLKTIKPDLPEILQWLCKVRLMKILIGFKGLAFLFTPC